MYIIELYNTTLKLIESNIIAACIVLIAAFILLSKCANIFVESAVQTAEKLHIPKLVIGIVLVSFATTTPELTVSLLSALSGNPEIALGNAIGSVICDDGVALALAGIISTAPILVIPYVLKTSGIFLLFIEIVTFLFIVFDNTLNRSEGAILVLFFIAYIFFLFYQYKYGKLKFQPEEESSKKSTSSAAVITFLFILSLCGLIVSSKYIIVSAVTIAQSIGISEAVIGLTVIALGTSIPEVATCIVAAYKKQGAIAVGNIIGADIMNICWIAGASAIANPLILPKKEILFMFPAMFIVVGLMLGMLRYKHSLTRLKGIILLTTYIIYIYLAVYVLRFSTITNH